MDSASDIRRRIDGTLSGGGICVFPAEVSVGFWRGDTVRRRVTDADSRKEYALPADRFISWDTFKERTTRSQVERRPVNRRVRTFFVHACLSSNSASPWLRRIVPPEHAGRSMRFAAALQKGLPGIAVIRSAPEYRELDPSLRADLDELARRYEEFLDEHGLFEPAWAPPEVTSDGQSYTVFFPELLEDWPEFASAVMQAGSVSVFECFADETDPGSITVSEYPDTLVEIRSVFDEIESLLSSGVAADEVVLTVAGLSECRDELEREARRRGLSLGMRAGLTLAEHTAGGIFRDLAEVVDRRFAPDECTRFFRSRAVPWIEPEAMELLSRFGVEHGCLSSRRFDAWRAAFEAGGSRKFGTLADEAGWPVSELFKQFEAVRTALERVVHAASFSEIRQNLYAYLIGPLVDPDAFDRDIEPVFQRCLTVLSEWVEVEQQTGISVEHPYAVFLSSLSEVVYVRPTDRAGIAVYPYRVSAGIAPEHHFVVGLGRGAITATGARSPFLQVYEWDRIGVTDRDMTEAFLRSYAYSGASTYLSYSLESFNGVCLSPPVTVVEATVSDEGLYDREVACWAGRASASDAGWYAPQTDGFRRYSDRQRVGGPDYRRQAVPPDSSTSRMLASLLRSDDGRIHVSAGAVDTLLGEPFGAFLGAYLGVEAALSVMKGSDPMSIGSLEHEAIEWVHRQLRECGCEALSSWRTHVSEAAISDHIRSYIQTRARRESPVPEVILLLLVPKLVRAVVNALETEALLIPGAVPHEAERSLFMDLPESIQIRGRVDALHRYGRGAYALVDYKKNSIPKKKEIETGEKTQIPLYRLMLEAQRQSLSGAYYVSFENVKERSRTVFGGEKPVIEETDWPDYRATLEAGLERLCAVLTRLDFRCADSDRGCPNCPTREICRSRYAHRESGRSEDDS